MSNSAGTNCSSYKWMPGVILGSQDYTRADQKVHEKVILYHIAFIDCNGHSQIETTNHSKLTEIEI